MVVLVFQSTFLAKELLVVVALVAAVGVAMVAAWLAKVVLAGVQQRPIVSFASGQRQRA